jgi:hypothetical protein
MDETTFFSLAEPSPDPAVLARFSFGDRDRFLAEAAWRMATYESCWSVCSYVSLPGCDFDDLGEQVVLMLQGQKKLPFDESQAWWATMLEVLRSYGDTACQA